MKLVTLAIITLIGPCLAADELPTEYEHDVSLWKPVHVPARTSYEAHGVFFHRANIANVEWTVQRQGQNVTAVLGYGAVETPAAERPAFDMTMALGSNPAVTPSRVLKVSDGWLAGYNRGEFGAFLWWFSTDGKERYKVSDHQINEFIIHHERIFAVEGLAHLGSDEGSLIEISQKAGRWRADTFVELPECADAITLLKDDRFCIATSRMLLAVSLNKRIEILVPRSQWDWLPINSIAVDAKSENVYIGMRQFVARYNLKRDDHTYEFLLPSLEFLNKRDAP